MGKITVTTGLDGVVLGGSGKIQKLLKKSVKQVANTAGIEKEVARTMLSQIIPAELEYDDSSIIVEDGVYTISYEASTGDIKAALKKSIKMILKAEIPVVEEEIEDEEDLDPIDDSDFEDEEFDDEDDEIDEEFDEDDESVEEIIVITETKSKKKKKKKNHK